MATLVAGIDEVGYGPILGPLVVASSIFLIEENPEEDMWIRLQNSIGKNKKGLGSRLLVTDSKKAWSKNAKVNQLERTAKAFINQLDLKGTVSFSSIIPHVTNDMARQAAKYPWYRAIYNSTIPEINLSVSNRLTDDMKHEGMEFIDFRCVCTDVEEYNRIVKTMDNKSWAVIFPMLELVRQIIAIGVFCRAKNYIIYSDRLGGRMYYEEILKQIPGFKSSIMYESQTISKYNLVDNRGRNLQIQFEVKADDKRLPVALASMVAKYTREKIMEHMNKYFKTLQPNLRPTAGYWTDGLRFLRDIEESGTLYASGLDIESMRRVK